MLTHSPSRQLAVALTVAGLAMAAPAQTHAQLVPLWTQQEVMTKLEIGSGGAYTRRDTTDSQLFTPWNVQIAPHQAKYIPCDPPEPPPNDQCVETTCDAFAGLIQVIYSQGVNFSGEGSGAWDGLTQSRYDFHSIFKLRFRIDIPVNYTIQLYANNGDLPPGDVFAALEGPTPDITLHYTQYGTLETTGTLGPGEYVIRGQTDTGGWRYDQYTDGGAFSGIFTIDPADSLPGTAGLPLDKTVVCGGTATFSIGSPGPPGTYSYQWRKGLTPLANGSQISGANTPTLTISNACTADAGYYSVVATVIGSSPTQTIPTRFALLTVVTNPTGVATGDVTPARASVFAPAMPNPFQGETALRYTVPPATRVVAAVYDASGARVRSLTNAVLSGTGSIAWDGRTQNGDRAPAGVYFVQLQAGTLRDTKKVVLLK